jgi:RNA polymerase sigma factor (sigma-70 family)
MANVQQQRLTPEQEREIAQRILGLEECVRTLVASVPAAAAVLKSKRGRTGRTRASAVDRLEAALEPAADETAPCAALREARAKWKEAQDLRWRLALSATRVAYREARRLAANPVLGEQDLVQEGLIGLLGAAKRFEPSKDIRFATYARWWVRALMTRAIDLGRTVRLSAGACEQLRNLRKQSRIYEAAGVSWSAGELATDLGLDTERVRRLLGVGAALSLDEPTDDENLSIGSTIADESFPEPEEAVARTEEMERLRAALVRTLPDRERRILTRRYGLGQERPHTLAEIARGLSLSRERVRQLERESLAVLRDAGIRADDAVAA